MDTCYNRLTMSKALKFEELETINRQIREENFELINIWHSLENENLELQEKLTREGEIFLGVIETLQLELQAKDKILEKFQTSDKVEEMEKYIKEQPSTIDAQTKSEVCIVSKSPHFPFSHQKSDVDFGKFEDHTRGIGSKLLNIMGFDGKCLGINGQGITNPIQVEERPRYARLGYDSGKRKIGESSKTTEEPLPLELQNQPIQGKNNICFDNPTNEDDIALNIGQASQNDDDV
ncbi:hypothetical protein KI387_043305, partial [Taxus chinensis]